MEATKTAGVSLVCCALIGTLVEDDGLIERSFAEAIATQGVISGTSSFARRMSQVHRARGRSPGDVLRVLFPDNEPRAQAAELAFDRALPDALSRSVIKPVPGAVEALADLRAVGARICVLTVFPRRVLDLVLDASDLLAHVDLVLCREDAPRGFPAPDLALTAAVRAGVGAVQDLAMVDATGAGMECGRRAGAGLIAGVLTGPHSPARLRAAGAMHVLASIADLPALLARLHPVAGAEPATENGTAVAPPAPARSAAVAATSSSVDVPAQSAAPERLQH